MSTSGLVVVYGCDKYGSRDKTIILERDRDGYPLMVMKELAESVLEVNKKGCSKELLTETLSGILIGIGTSEHGFGYRIKKESEGKLTPARDLTELYVWTYVIDCFEKTISVYQDNLDDYVSPYDYIKCLYEQYQEPSRLELDSILSRLRELGWKVNPMSNAEKFIRAC
jgi:hypothetical protein